MNERCERCGYWVSVTTGGVCGACRALVGLAPATLWQRRSDLAWIAGRPGPGADAAATEMERIRCELTRRGLPLADAA